MKIIGYMVASATGTVIGGFILHLMEKRRKRKETAEYYRRTETSWNPGG